MSEQQFLLYCSSSNNCWSYNVNKPNQTLVFHTVLFLFSLNNPLPSINKKTLPLQFQLLFIMIHHETKGRAISHNPELTNV